MKIKYLAFIFLSFLSVNLIAQVEISVSKEIQLYNGQLYYIHEVKTGHTLFSIARAYNVSQDTIIASNSFAKEGIKVGQFLRIPVINTSQQTDSQSPKTTTGQTITSQQVQTDITPKQDTLFLVKFIAKENILIEQLARLFDSEIQKIKLYNSTIARHEIVRINDTVLVPVSNSKKIIEFLQNYPETKVYTLIKHPLARRETLFSVSRIYNSNVDEIKKFNPEISENIRVGQEIWVPVNHVFTIPPKAKVIEKRVIECKKIKTKETYEVALLIPLRLDRINEIVIPTEPRKPVNTNFASLEYLQFYEGFLMSLDKIDLNKAKINIRVFDVDNNEQEITKLINEGKLDVDLIVGPFFSKPFEVLSNYVQSKNIKVLDLYMSGESKTSLNNNNIISVLPSVKSQLANLVNFIDEHYPQHKVVVVFSNNDNENFLMQTLNNESVNAKNKYHFVNYSEVGFSGLSANLSDTEKSIIINFSNNEIFLNNFLRLLFDAAKHKPITLFGLPSWLRFNSIELRYLNHFNTHFYSSVFIDYSSPLVQEFVKGFQENYKTDPNRLAFLGYDIGTYFLNSLTYFGTDFNYCMNQTNVETISTQFNFLQFDENSQWINNFVMVYYMSNYQLINARKTTNNGE